MTRYDLTSLRVVLAATALVRVLNRRLGGPRFLVYVHTGRVVIGGMLLLQSVFGGTGPDQIRPVLSGHR